MNSLIQVFPRNWFTSDARRNSPRARATSRRLRAAGHRRLRLEPLEDRRLLSVSIGGEIHGVKWHDLDGDGARDAGEPGLPGWTIYLDADGDGELDTGERSTPTESDGAYAFTGLDAGTYVVAEVAQPGWEQTYPRGAGHPAAAPGDPAASWMATTVGPDSPSSIDLGGIPASGGGVGSRPVSESVEGEVPRPETATWPEPKPFSRAVSQGDPSTAVDARSPATFLSVNCDPEGDMPLQVVFAPDGASVLVVNRDTDNLLIYDAATRALTGVVPVGDYPHDVAVSLDGRYAAVPNVFSNTVSIVDLATRSVAAHVPITGSQPYRVAVTADSAFVVVGVINDARNSSFSVISLSTLTEVRSIPSTPQGVCSWAWSGDTGKTKFYTTPLAVSSDNSTIVLPDAGNSQVTLYDLHGVRPPDCLATAAWPVSVDISRDGTTAVIGHSFSAKTITRIDLVSRSITGRFTTASDPGGIRITPDKNYAIAAISNNVIFVNLTSGATTATLSTGWVGDIEISFDGRYAFVSHYNARVIDIASQSIVASLTLAACEESAMSPVAHKAVALSNLFADDVHFYSTNGPSSFVEGRIESGAPPEGDGPLTVAISSDGKTVVAGNVVSGNVAIIDVPTRSVRKLIETGERVLEVAVTADGHYAVVANAEQDTVSIVDLSRDVEAVVATLPVADRPANVLISPDGQMAYVTTVASPDAVHFIRLAGAESSVVGSLATGDMGMVYGMTSGMGLTADGSILAICISFDDELLLVDTASRTEIARVPLPSGSMPTRVAFSPDGSRAYVLNPVGGTVGVIEINGAASRLLAIIPGIDSPATLNIDAAGAFVYVGSVATSGGICVIDTASNTVVQRLPLPGAYVRAAFLSPRDSILYVATTLPMVLYPYFSLPDGNALYRLKAAGAGSWIADSTPLASPPSDLVFSDSLNDVVLAQPVPDGVDIVHFSATEIPGTHVVVLDPGGIATGVDFGNHALPADIRGQKFSDRDGDGAKDADEPGLQGWTIQLDLNNDETIDRTAVTDDQGDYLFADVPFGTHRITEVGRSGWDQTCPGVGSGYGYTITLDPGEHAAGIDFGNHAQPGEIHGSKWNDWDGDGAKDPEEPGLEDWTFYLDLNTNGQWDTGEPQTTTNSAGQYAFIDLEPGEYTVAEVPQAGWTQTYPAAGAPKLAAPVIVDQGAGEPVADSAAASVAVPSFNPLIHHEAFSPPILQSGSPSAPLFDPLLFPPSFDLRTGGYVTPVKNQGACGSCWAFATYGPLESAILKAGGPARDLSENHLKNYHGFDLGPCDGGNSYMSQAYLSRWSGPVDEADDPYHDWDDRPSPGGPVQYYVRQSLVFDTDEEIKNALMSCGALYTSLYWNGSFFRAGDSTYYYSGSTPQNHGVTIVGWDDNLGTPAPTPGAWLIKNSWGSDWGNEGYFWLSYADTMGGNYGVSFSDAVAPQTFKKVHYYDDFGQVAAVDTPYAFNAFTVGPNEALSAVQFWTQADGAGYDLRIYDTFSDGSLSNLLASTTGTLTYAGYHTVDLPSRLPLTAGDSFYVSLHIANGGVYPHALDLRSEGYSSNSTAHPGESYYSFDGAAWTDLTSFESTANFAIKALTVDYSVPGTHRVALDPAQVVTGIDFGNHWTHAPTAVDDAYSANEDAVLSVPAPGLLGNDTDPDPGDTLSVVGVRHTITVPLPGLVGTYGLERTVSFDARARFTSISSVAIHWSGQTTPGLYHGDGFGMPADEYHVWLAPLVCNTPLTHPYFWGSVLRGQTPGVPEYFDILTPLLPESGANYDFLLDGTGDLRVLLSAGIPFSAVPDIFPIGSISSAELQIVGAVDGLDWNPDGSFTYDPRGRFDWLPAGQTAIDTFEYTVSDSQGLTDTATVTITIAGLNDAPVLDPGGLMSLAPINEDQHDEDNYGTLVKDILASAGGDRITDVDDQATEGIAITTVDASSGTWQYKVDPQGLWTDYVFPDGPFALLLAANSDTRIRFKPKADWSGTVTGGITFRAWDRTVGENGGWGNVSATGGTTAFSTAVESASIIVWKFDEPGFYDPETSWFYLRNSYTSGNADVAFGYGAPGAGWLPIQGDWDGNSSDTAGLYDPANSWFYLRNSNTTGAADISFGFGTPGAGWLPIAGDWNRDGFDEVGLYDPANSVFHLIGVDPFGYGAPGAGWLPIAGDWNGDGVDTIGLFAPATSCFYLRNSNTPGMADVAFVYGTPYSGCAPLAGDWNHSGFDNVGLYDPADSSYDLIGIPRFYFPSPNTTNGDWLPWNGAPPPPKLPPVQVIDDGDIGYSQGGNWTYSANQGGFENDFCSSAKGNGSDSASWTFTVTPGRYQVSATWKQGRNRATNAPFSVYDGTALLGPVLVNQKNAPNDFTDTVYGGTWEKLVYQGNDGVFQIGTTSLTVKLTDKANRYVVADAIRIERVDSLKTDATVQIDSEVVGAVPDADSNDITSVGLFDPLNSVFQLRSDNSTGNADYTFGYGEHASGWKPLVGDWNGDGADTVGFYDPVSSVFYVRNSLSAGYADLTFGYGEPGSGWEPLVGDWDGDGIDTVGFYDPVHSMFYLRNSLSTGYADVAFAYGTPGAGWTPLVGDWDGDGTDTIGLFDPQNCMWYLRDSLSTGFANHTFAFGNPTLAHGHGADNWAAIIGDWNGTQGDTIGFFDPHDSVFMLRNSLTTGMADVTFGYGAPGAGWHPLIGTWQTPGKAVDSGQPEAKAVDQIDLAALVAREISVSDSGDSDLELLAPEPGLRELDAVLGAGLVQ